MANAFQVYVEEKFAEDVDKLEIIMAILSNHVPECLVECQVSCPADKLDKVDGETPAEVESLHMGTGRA